MKTFGNMITENLLRRQDKFKEENARSVGAVISMFVWNALLIIAPPPYRVWGVIWPLVGIIVLYARLASEARKFDSSIWAELLLAWKVWTDVLLDIYFYPFGMAFNLVTNTEWHSFRDRIHGMHTDELFQQIGRTDRAYDAAQRKFGCDVMAAREQSEQLQAMPEQLMVSAKTSAVCGATVMTMATSAASAASPVPVTPTNNVSISASGWITAVGDIPAKGKPEPSLEYARVFLTVSDDALHASIFTELALDAFQYQNPDVLKRYYATFNLGNNTSVYVGRMYVAGGWMLPGPTSLETVDYPRFPFTFQGYAVQLEKTIGQWHLIADVSGATGLSFLSGGQFDTIETSGHLSQSFGSAYEAALTWQVSPRFTRLAIDGRASPVSWLDTRGMIYYDHEMAGSQNTTSIGCYGFASVRPLKSLPWLSFHGQADYKIGLDATETVPVTITGGVRMKFGTHHSAIMDYHAGFGSTRAGDSDGVRMAWQTTF